LIPVQPITFDVISKDRAYLGVWIFPEYEYLSGGLKRKTALLPKVKLQAAKMFIGRDTQNSILSGVVFGTAALTKELAARIKRYLGKTRGLSVLAVILH